MERKVNEIENCRQTHVNCEIVPLRSKRLSVFFAYKHKNAYGSINIASNSIQLQKTSDPIQIAAERKMNSDETVSQSADEPTWLDEAYILKILNSYTGNQLEKLHSFTKKPATTKGENYASAMHLVNVVFSKKTMPDTRESLSMIIKSRLENELMAQIEEDFNVFEREAMVYTTFMPAVEKLLRSIGDETVFGPRPIYADDHIIVQQNLKLLGYAIEDIKKGLNYDQCHAILIKLAKYHAVSMVLYKQQPQIFRHHLPGNVSENPSPLHDLYINSIKTCIEYCRTNPKLQYILPKLEDFGAHIIPKMINVFSRHQVDRYHVLNHGDVWVNNMMFLKNKSGAIEDVLFVDFQEGFFGSPGIDWNYFMFSSWQPEVFKLKFHDLVQLYHTTLADVLNKLSHRDRIPTIDDVHKEIANKAFHGLTTATCLLPILINEHEDLADPENFLLETDEALETRRMIFNNPKFGERLEMFFAYFVEKGIL